MKVVDLFCGAGGFSEGFERAGFEIIRAYDIWGPAIVTHNKNHGHGNNPARKGDIYELSILDDEKFEEAIPDSEIIIGSPPCVAFSNSNKSGKADKTLGINLINAFLRIVARKMSKPNSKLKYWVMENVENSQNFIEDLYDASDLEWPGLRDFVLKIHQKNTFNMKYFGVPTNRKRFICGNYPNLENLNNDEEQIKLKDVLKALGEPKPDSFQLLKSKVKDPIYGFEILSNELTDHHYIKEIPPFEWKKAKRQKEDKGYMGRMSFPENEDKPARTIMATLSASSRESMIFMLDEKSQRYRYPTIREAATLMSFPIDFRFYGDSDATKYRMVGNAVSPKFSYEIAKAIRTAILNEDSEIIIIRDRFSTRKIFDNTEFTNLNGIVFPLKKEKPKRWDSKFNHHVPYLIKNAFRVGLNNKIEDLNVKWEVKIHYSQGKNAKIYKNFNIDEKLFNEKELEDMYNFVNKYISLINTSKNFQSVYCMTTEEKQKKIGPDELLEEVKRFVEKTLDYKVFIEEIGKEISRQLVIAYYLLSNIMKGIEVNE